MNANEKIGYAFMQSLLTNDIEKMVDLLEKINSTMKRMHVCVEMMDEDNRKHLFEELKRLNIIVDTFMGEIICMEEIREQRKNKG